MYALSDYRPPKTWEQFEELCADLFQSSWQDPALVRHGRSGQTQHGVDIVGRQASAYPVGLQCKKKGQWPPTKLSKAEIDREVKLAEGFTPPLKAFWLLTTAPNDANLQEHVRKINIVRRASNSFEVVLLGWEEIVRRVTADPQVAAKHFGSSSDPARSPLLGVFPVSSGKLTISSGEMLLTAEELIQDFRDWPSGHIVVRQAESDKIASEIAQIGTVKLTQENRKHRFALRNQLHVLTKRETFAAQAIRLFLTHPETLDWIWIWDIPHRNKITARAIVAFLDGYFVKSSGQSQSNAVNLRMNPKGDREARASALLRPADIEAILAIQKWRVSQYGKPLTTIVDELPDDVLAEIALPRILDQIVSKLNEERIPIEQLQKCGYFDLGKWSIEMAN